MRLTIYVEGTSALATFEFFGIPENPGIPHGMYTMSGDLVDGTLVLVGEHWIEQPPTFEMVGLIASVPATPTAQLVGRIDNPLCGTFIVERFPS